MKRQSLKELQTLKSQLESDKKLIAFELSDCKKRLNECNQKIESVNRKIKIATSVAVVSEHAVLRYLERKMGIDVSEIKS